MQFDPKDVGEQERKILKEGEYDFEVIDAENTVFEDDEGEHEQIKLSLRVFHDDGTIRLNTWVGYPKKKLWRLEQFCKAVGLDKQWEAGEVTPDDCTGAAGKCLLGIWNERNTVRKFIADESPTKKTNPKKALKAKTKAKEFYIAVDDEADGDDIPF